MRSTHNRPLVVAGLMVALAVGVALVMGLTRRPAQLDPSTPEGTVQQYLQAILDEDWEAAHGFLSADLRDRCPATRLAEARPPESAQITLVESRSVGEVMLVEVRVSHVEAPTPFDAYEYDHTETFSLEREGARWVLTEVPWPIYSCRR
ncbi:MAG: hypothetical protein ACRDVM_05915 [Acidimicrobiia bacterium]